MRIDRLTVKNFKGFTERTFEFALPVRSTAGAGSFHVMIGENGSGKTSALDALAVALGIWHVAAPTAGWRKIEPREVHLIERRAGDTVRFDPAPSAEVEAVGLLGGKRATWKRMVRKGATKTTNAEAREALAIIETMTRWPENAKPQSLPVLAYYGAGRAWLPAREAFMRPKVSRTSRFDAYYNCLDGRVREAELTQWFMQELLESAGRGRERDGLVAVKQAVLACVPEGEGLRFDTDRKELVVKLGRGELPFSCLSDGQRAMVAMVADLAIKAVLLNPHLGRQATKRSSGMVLIDELDLHLHPKWQRRVADDLRRVFPRVQFIATTHSPFIVQALQPGELMPLDAQAVPHLGNLSLEDIAGGLMKVNTPEISPRYRKMVGAAKEYLLTLEKAAKSPRAKLASYKRQLAGQLAPYADNPAYQAFLELKREGKIGSPVPAGPAGRK